MTDASAPPQVHSDPAILGGTPVFAGTRLPIATLLACVDSGDAWERLVASWPWLTEAHLQAARAWVAEHPDFALRTWPLAQTGDR